MISNFKGTLFVGQPVYMSLYNTGAGYICNLSEGCNQGDCESIYGIVGTGGGEVKIVFRNGKISECPESLLRSGVQYGVVEGEPASANELISLLENAEKVKAEKEDEERQEREAFALAVKNIGDKYPHLKQLKDKKAGRSELAHVAENIRKELKPLGKFSVRIRNSSVHVDWEDGANKSTVSEVTDKYRAGSFNGMEDIYEYTSSPFTEVFGSANYIFLDRAYSDKAVQAVCDKISERFNYSPNVEDYRKGLLDEMYKTEFYNELRDYHQVPNTAPKQASKKEKSLTAEVSDDSQSYELTLSEEEHTRTQKKLFVVRLDSRVERDVFNALCKRANDFSGYWSKFKDGFIFDSLEASDSFMN
ncbi:hypothetical protein VIBNISOn1_1050049 [Vibrio nigripulchritudo SOn1]|uniref:Large polyvalent protein associated domain-containing protein n=1 Tax=Vibrio nigripulchritudo SOn1 TaxID=1238450 RepID=A0AAV2VI77_9VIBR|nr:LPD29 domain-containing protein [Vibrio nigripulchritudo]CCO44223.1 hypothetical protein VIBNISOn1_1050049 [Vibrio nigripulchritudo SOn1]